MKKYIYHYLGSVCASGASYLVGMLPLAVSGPTVIGVASVAALLLAWVLLRAEVRDDAREESERESER